MGPLRVLVIDDDRTLRETVSEILELDGHTTMVAGSAAEARQFLQPDSIDRPDVAVIDYRLPDVIGLDLADECKLALPDVGVILLTGHASTGSAIEAVGRADEYLVKPTPPAAIQAAVARAGEKSQLRSQNRALLAELRNANAELEVRVEERTREINGLLDVASAITRSLEVDDVLRGAVEAVAAVSGTTVGVYLAEVSGGYRNRAQAGPGTLPDRLTSQVDTPPGARLTALDVPGGALLAVRIDGPSTFVDAAAATITTGLRNAEAFVAEREASRLKSMMLATVSHELRTPLTVLTGFLELLIHAPDQPVEDRVSHYSAMRRNALRLTALVNDLLDSGALQGGSVRVDCEQVRLRNVASQAVAQVGLEATTSIDIPEDLSAWIDAGRLEQILVNLLSNAKKYGDTGATIDARLDGDVVRLGVEDNGRGFPDAFLATAFDPFTQAGTDIEATRVGAGLGLYICRGFAEAMGGRIAARNTANGARVDLVLAARAPAPVPAGADESVSV